MNTGTTTPTGATPTKKTLITKISSGFIAAGLTGWLLVANYWPTPKKPEFPTAVYKVDENFIVYGFEDGRFETYQKWEGNYINTEVLKRKTIDSILKEEDKWLKDRLENGYKDPKTKELIGGIKPSYQKLRDILNKTD